MAFSMLLLQSGVVNKFPFDPLGLDSPTNAEKEIKNGRLAMVTLFIALPDCRVDAHVNSQLHCHALCHLLDSIDYRRWRVS